MGGDVNNFQIGKLMEDTAEMKMKVDQKVWAECSGMCLM